MTIDAGDVLELVVGSARLTMKKDGTIELRGGNITIVGAGKVTVKEAGDIGVRGNKIAGN